MIQALAGDGSRVGDSSKGKNVLDDVAEPPLHDREVSVGFSGSAEKQKNGPADWEGTFILLPVIGEPGSHVALFNDGSYTRWRPGQWSISQP